MTTHPEDQHASHPTILSYVRDIPNLCSLTGLGCTVSAIYFCVLGNYSAAMIGMIWAVAFDWADGLIARRMKGRTGNDRSFGAQLDVSIDIVSYGVTPAVLLLSYGNFEAAFLPGAFILLAAAALRLSYFSTFGLSGSSEYTGLALDNNSILLVFLFAFESTLGTEIFSAVLYVSCLGLAALNVSQIKTPKSALEQLRGSEARLDSVSQGRRGIGVRITPLRAILIPPTLSDIMIHPYSNETQTRWDHGDFKVQLIQPNNTRPMGFCDGSAADLAELQQMAESEGADEMRIEKKSLKTGREIWTLHGGG